MEIIWIRRLVYDGGCLWKWVHLALKVGLGGVCGLRSRLDLKKGLHDGGCVRVKWDSKAFVNVITVATFVTTAFRMKETSALQISAWP